MAIAVTDEILALLEGFTGQLLRSADPGYEEARRVHNGLIDRRPALIARCRGVADVVATVNAAREQGWEMTIRGSGHNVAGLAVSDGSVMIDLSAMKGIHVDPAARTVRAQGGVTWAEFNRETQLHGLATTGGTVSSTGIAGLTLGAGVGWLLGVHGLAADNLISAEVVTADGRVVSASEREHADLFWALRGGGGNFGVVTSFVYRLHPIARTITGGLIAHPFAAAPDLLRFYREFTAAGVPDELTVLAGLVHAPDGSGAKLAALVVCHAGDPEQAERDLAPLRSFGAPALVMIDAMPYPAVNTLFDASYPRGALNYWRSNFVDSLSDEAIDVIVDQYATTPSSMTAIVFEHFHGEATRIPVEATACANRAPGWNFLTTSVWTDPAASDANIAWTRDLFARMAPFLASRRWLNYTDVVEDDAIDRARAVYGPNLPRLVQVKNAWDPGNLFHVNLNIRPG